MTSRFARILLTASAVALAAIPGTTTAMAATATTWTVTPGGAVQATTTKVVILKDIKNGIEFGCRSATTEVDLKSGSGLPGSALGSVSSFVFKSCSGPLYPMKPLAPGHLPWTFSAVSYKSGRTSGTISGIHLSLSDPNLPCFAVLDGTGSGEDNGTANVTYSNGTKDLTFTTGGNLHFYKVLQCAGLVHDGDPAALLMTEAVSPPQTITSP